MQLITLTTDFGLSDWFVGTMKGVILGIAPRAAIVDITHEIPAGDIRAGAFALRASYRFFPKGTVHVVVVDPGVGSERKAIVVETDNYFFIGPDNGVLSWALAKERIKTIRTLQNERYFLQPISRTFHGRDIFAPVAAHLASGVPIQKLGPILKDFISLPWPRPKRGRNRIEGEVIYIDGFGNAITNLDCSLLRSPQSSFCEVHAKPRCVCPLKRFYQAVPQKTPVAIAGSSDLIEISINGGSAEERLGLKIGTPVMVSWRISNPQRQGR